MLTKTTPGGAPLVFPDGAATRDASPNDLRELIAAYRAGDMRAASEAFARTMHAIDKDDRVGHDDATQADWARTVSAALGVFVQPDFVVPEEFAARVLSCCPLIANVLASVGTSTDPHLKMIEGQPQQGFKSAVLYSPRNTLGMDFGKMLADNPMLASMWLNQAVKVMYSANADCPTAMRMLKILNDVDGRLEPAGELQELYFLVSYFGDIVYEKTVKRAINASIKRHLDTKITNTPNPRKVAVWAEYWNKGHSVYRTLKGFIDALRPHFDEITLIHCVKKTEDLDATGFDRVIRLEHDGFRINPTPLDGNEWGAVIFADVGMTLPSILMSNLRIAPVQILLTGHPVSTFGGHMDWFVSGALTDTNPDNYSERLAILPHFGAIHEPVEWKPSGKRHGRDEIVVNVSAYGQKIHHDFLSTINEAFGHATKPVKLQLFCGNAPMRCKGLRAFADAVAAAVPNAHVELIAHLPYDDYMARIEQADFGIDNWPFGGSNVISDQIAAGVPVLCMAGDRWFNSVGPAMVRAMGFTVAEDRAAFLGMLTGLVGHDDAFRANFRHTMKRSPTANVYDRSDAEIFARFVSVVAGDPNYMAGTNPVWLGGTK
jgi:hypothetical protein